MAIAELQITVLAENTVRRRDLIAEHGLALWLRADGRSILFDTGQGLALAHNADRLGIRLAEARDVVLSHGHYDHVGGLAASPDLFRHARVFVHPEAFGPRYSWAGTATARYAGASIRSLEDLKSLVADVVETTGWTPVADDIWATGPIPRETTFEDTGGRFSLDAAGEQEDVIVDDQALCVRTERGLVVLLGCAHAGVVNTLRHVEKNFGGESIRAVLGGMHLLRASDERIERTLAAFGTYDLQLLAPAHCTGVEASRRIAEVFAERCRELSVGQTIGFGGADVPPESPSSR